MRGLVVLRFLVAPLLLLGALAAPALAGPYSRLQVLLPGETAAPGTTSGKTGSPTAQTVGVPFTITVRACDSGWNTVATVTDAIQVLSSDASATLPAPAQLAAGLRQFAVTLNAGGTFTVYAHDQTDTTVPDGTSSPVTSLALQSFDISTIGKNQNAGVPVTVTITARDPRGNVVSGFNGTINMRELTSFGEGRVGPDHIALSSGTWTGPVSFYRADETNHPRGNVYLQAELPDAPSRNGASNPFLVYAGSFSRVQIVVPGQTPQPGSVSGLVGSPATQIAGRGFPVSVYATDNWWNPVGGGDQVRITSSDPGANTPVSGSLSNGYRQFTITLATVGNQRLTVSDLTAPSRTGMTTSDIAVIPSAANGFAIGAIASPQVAGVPVAVTIRATDASGNTIPDYAADANLSANTGAGSITPERITFANGVWSGTVTFRGAGGAVRFTCSDFSVPPHTGISNSFAVQPGPFAGLQVVLPGESVQGGTPAGKTGTPQTLAAGALFTLTVRAVDAYWNMVPGVADSVRLGSDDLFASIPAETTLANGQVLIPARLYKSGSTRIWASDPVTPDIRPDTSSTVTVTGGSFARVLILAPGESPAPGTSTGRTGTATDQSINYAFTVRVLATDSWWNPVGGVSDQVHVSSGDPLARLPRDTTLTDGRADMVVRLATGGFQQISVSDVTNPAKTGSTTQVRAISSGFHLEATAAPATVKAGEPFTLTVRVTNDAGSVIQEVNSFVTVDVQRAADREPGHGTLLTTQFQLLQGQRSMSETYTFAEDIVMVVRDDAGNAPGVTGTLAVTPGDPAVLRLTSAPPWVGGDKHATLTAHLADAYDNGVPGRPVVFSVLSGNGTATPIDSLTAADGTARADFLSPREPETDQLRATAGSLSGDLALQVAFVDPNAAGGTVTNYPNPFHPPGEGTTLAYRLDDNADVRIRIFTLSGELVRDETLPRLVPGGLAGLNEWVWDGRNGAGHVVASGGYVALIEAQGQGQTMHVMRRKIAVVR